MAFGGVTMSLHKLTAGSGYDYLTRQVAAHDRTEGARPGLASYYTDKGETPGLWVGSGMAGIDGLAVGDEVTAEQMQAAVRVRAAPPGRRSGEERLQGPDLTETGLPGGHPAGVAVQGVHRRRHRVPVEVAQRIEDHAAALGHPRDYPVSADGPGPDPHPGRRPSSSAPSTAGTPPTPASCPGPSPS